jgi:hypothetical protein
LKAYGVLGSKKKYLIAFESILCVRVKRRSKAFLAKKRVKLHDSDKINLWEKGFLKGKKRNGIGSRIVCQPTTNPLVIY